MEPVLPDSAYTRTLGADVESLDRQQKYPSPSEHYKILIEDARSLGDRRETINNLFVGIVSLIAGGQGYLLVTLPGRLEGLAATIVATAFGLGLCKVWGSVLKSYKALLDMRYHTLKEWERIYEFPSIQRYYISEDILYGPLNSATDLSKSVDPKWVGLARNFISMYVVLPRTARNIFYTMAFLQCTVFLLESVVPVLLRQGILSQMLPFILRMLPIFAPQLFR